MTAAAESEVRVRVLASLLANAVADGVLDRKTLMARTGYRIDAALVTALMLAKPGEIERARLKIR